jgi:hypothetical protein
VNFDPRLNTAWWALRIGLGLGLFLAGLDKYFDILTNWGMYLSPLAERMLPVSGAAFMHIAGAVEMTIGLAILTRWTRIGSYFAMAWLLAIAMNLAAGGTFWDLAMRDVEIALGAFALAKLTEAHAAAQAASAGTICAPGNNRAV